MISPKGIVEPIEMHGLCNKLRVLLSDRKNVASDIDWRRLQDYAKAMRCFTIAERNIIDQLYSYLARRGTDEGSRMTTPAGKENE